MAVKSAYMSRKGGKAEKTDLKNTGFSAEQEQRAYRDMLLIRRFEEKAGQLYGMGFIGGGAILVVKNNVKGTPSIKPCCTLPMPVLRVSTSTSAANAAPTAAAAAKIR